MKKNKLTIDQLRIGGYYVTESDDGNGSRYIVLKVDSSKMMTCLGRSGFSCSESFTVKTPFSGAWGFTLATEDEAEQLRQSIAADKYVSMEEVRGISDKATNTYSIY